MTTPASRADGHLAPLTRRDHDIRGRVPDGPTVALWGRHPTAIGPSWEHRHEDTQASETTGTIAPGYRVFAGYFSSLHQRPRSRADGSLGSGRAGRHRADDRPRRHRRRWRPADVRLQGRGPD